MKTNNFKDIYSKKIYHLSTDGEFYYFFTNDNSYTNKEETIVVDNYKNIFYKIFKTNIISSLCMLFILLLFVFSNFTIREVAFSNDKYYNYNVYSDVKKYVKNIGPIYYLDENINDISNELRHKYYNFAYIGLRKVGSKLIIDIKKQEEYKKDALEKNVFCDLVATVDGKVVGIEVEKGKTIIAINQIVSKGDVLVSGNLNYNQNANIENCLVIAKGNVLIEYAYYKEVEIKKNIEIISSDLVKNTSYEISIFKQKIFKKNIDENGFFIMVDDIFNIENVFKVSKYTYYKKEYEKYSFNENEAKEAALINIYLKFNEEKVSEKEKIEFIKLVNMKQDDEKYIFCFLIKQIKNSVECRYYT